ncbi:MAG: hypothetical protein M3198_04230 [Actinomycetota bacterium]|nr:hypothetical protein [Actinomycetota bacterium]
MSIDGKWRVRRLAGLLPPFGVTKRIAGGRGWTFFLGIPVGFFRVRGRRLEYVLWPVVDEVDPSPDGSWEGRARAGRWEFARFRLTPLSLVSTEDR